MKCPLQHDAADYRFGTARIEEGILVKICPKCGIVFVPGVEEKENASGSAETSQLEDEDVQDLPPDKQILKWP